MSDYKLMPEEATPEMLAAGEYALQAGCYASGIYADMRAAAPNVQMEPVAWGAFYSGGKYSGQLHRHDSSEEQIDRYIAIVHGSHASLTLRKGHLFTTPQPPFQLPEFATDPDDSDEVASLWDHGFKRGWNSCLESVAKTMQPLPCQECGGDGAGGEHEEDCAMAQPAEQKPAPDVTQLVEALEEIENPIKAMRDRLQDGERLDCFAAVQLAGDAEYLRSIAREALAPYRKGVGQ